MIPITVPKLTSYICIISNPIVFEMTKQHELRTKGKIDLIDANIISLSVVCF
jgi:Cu(I)/Ag(I) efflux system membrane protein CusA/SilA